MTMELGALNGTNGVMIEGREDRDLSGRAGGFAGDLNGDGRDDLAIGSLGADPLGRESAGQTDVLYGRPDFGGIGKIDLGELNATLLCRIFGARSGDFSGEAILGGYDFNGDSRVDLIIGAPSAFNETGESFILWGGPEFCRNKSIDLAFLSKTEGCRIRGWHPGDRSGTSFAAGDFEGRGFPSLAIGAPNASPDVHRVEAGQIFVLPTGPGFCADGHIQLSNEFCLINGIYPRSHSGRSFASLRDFNGDQRPDLIIGAPDVSLDFNRYHIGQAYLLFGGQGFCVRELAGLNGVKGAIFTGEEEGDQFGFSVAEVDNFNGNRLSTFFSGADLAHFPGRDYAGKTYAVFGSSDLGGNGTYEIADFMDGIRGVVFVGTSFGEQSGSAVAGVHDFSGDGIPDALIGAYGFSPSDERMYAGRVYGIFGHIGTWGNGTFDLQILNESTGVIYNGIEEGDGIGLWVSYAGDINDDGAPDAFIGASLIGYEDNGYAFAVFGHKTITATSSLPTSTYGTTSLFNTTEVPQQVIMASNSSWAVLGIICAMIGLGVAAICGWRRVFPARQLNEEGEPNEAMGCTDTLLTHLTAE